MVEVREGLKDGDDVILNPKVLLGNAAKTREEAAPAQGPPRGKGGGDPTKKGMGGKAPGAGGMKGAGGGGKAPLQQG
jgi:HlyD family secretion protein